MGSPTRFISRALLWPTRRGRRWVPPKPGMIPSLISGWPKSAERAAIRTSQDIASSQPPPKARPLTAAIVAIPSRPSSRKSAWALWIRASPRRLVHRRERLDVRARAVEEGVRGGDHQRAHARGLGLLPHLAEVLDHLRGDRVHLAVRQPRDRHALLTRLELDDLGGWGRVIGVGLRVGVEALSALLTQAALGDEAAQDPRRREALPVALPGVLQALQDRVEALHVGLHERRHQAPPRVEARARHQPEVDVAVDRHALLEHQAGLHERLQREQLHELRHVRLALALPGWARPRGCRSRRRRSSPRACPRRRASASPSARRSARGRRTPQGAPRRAAPCRGPAGSTRK